MLYDDGGGDDDDDDTISSNIPDYQVARRI